MWDGGEQQPMERTGIEEAKIFGYREGQKTDLLKFEICALVSHTLVSDA